MKKFAEREIIRTELREKDGYEYRYDLTLSEGKRVADFKIPLYSISVEMKCKENDRITQNGAENLFSDFGKATSFFNKIVDNLATPIDLSYIIEDEFYE